MYRLKELSLKLHLRKASHVLGMVWKCPKCLPWVHTNQGNWNCYDIVNVNGASEVMQSLHLEKKSPFSVFALTDLNCPDWQWLRLNKEARQASSLSFQFLCTEWTCWTGKPHSTPFFFFLKNKHFMPLPIYMAPKRNPNHSLCNSTLPVTTCTKWRGKPLVWFSLSKSFHLFLLLFFQVVHSW